MLGHMDTTNDNTRSTDNYIHREESGAAIIIFMSIIATSFAF